MKYKMNKAPMGWNSYDYYDTTVNEEQIRNNAKYMAEHLASAGWEYIVVDIQWYAHNPGSQRDQYQYIPFGDVEMDEFGRLLPDPVRFPSSENGAGFAPLAQYIHELGLKFGIHIMRGIPRIAAHLHLPIYNSDSRANDVANPSSICGWNPDMYGIRKDTPGGQAYYDSIVDLYAEWGVDFIKCDDICNTNIYKDNPYSAEHEIGMLSKAIEKSGREIVLSLSPGPALIEKAWHYEKYANMWRITDDFWDTWPLLENMFERCELWQNHVAAGSYPDCDMLPLGMLGKGFGDERKTNFTQEEQKTMMTLWCMFGSPLMIGAELTLLDDWTKDVLTNVDLTKLLSNDYRGGQEVREAAYVIWSCCSEKSDEWYLAVFNLLDEEQAIYIENNKLDSCQLKAEMKLKEIWSGEEYRFPGDEMEILVPPHGVKLYRFQGIS